MSISAIQNTILLKIFMYKKSAQGRMMLLKNMKKAFTLLLDIKREWSQLMLKRTPFQDILDMGSLKYSLNYGDLKMYYFRI